MATPVGVTKEPPDEIVVCSPVCGSTRRTPPGPPNALRSAMRMSQGLRVVRSVRSSSRSARRRAPARRRHPRRARGVEPALAEPSRAAPRTPWPAARRVGSLRPEQRRARRDSCRAIRVCIIVSESLFPFQPRQLRHVQIERTRRFLKERSNRPVQLVVGSLDPLLKDFHSAVLA